MVSVAAARLADADDPFPKGPIRVDSNREPRKIASEAAEAIRELNYATLDRDNLAYAGAVSKTVLALIELVDRLPQALDQLTVGLRAVEARDYIRMDDGSDVHEQVEMAAAGLADASAALSAVRKGLQDASTPLFHMGAPYAPDDDDEDDDE